MACNRLCWSLTWLPGLLEKLSFSCPAPGASIHRVEMFELNEGWMAFTVSMVCSVNASWYMQPSQRCLDSSGFVLCTDALGWFSVCTMYLENKLAVYASPLVVVGCFPYLDHGKYISYWCNLLIEIWRLSCWFKSFIKSNKNWTLCLSMEYLTMM